MPYEDPDWPSRATAEGQEVRFAAGLSNPGNPRRAGRMLLWFGVFLAVVVVLVLLSARL